MNHQFKGFLSLHLAACQIKKILKEMVLLFLALEQGVGTFVHNRCLDVDTFMSAGELVRSFVDLFSCVH